MAHMKKVFVRLNTRIKRIGFIVLLIGSVFTLIGATQIGSDLSSYRWLGRFLAAFGDALVFDRRSYLYYPLASIGPYTCIAGLLLSFLYDRTLGLLVDWVQRGSVES